MSSEPVPKMQTKERFTVPGGIEVQVDALYVTGTYGSVLEGFPNERQTSGLREAFQETLARIWGQRPVQEIEPVRRAIPTRPGRFLIPPLAVGLWLSSNYNKGDPEADGSSLVVVWYQDEFEGLPRPPSEVLASIRWDELAQTWAM